MFPAICCIRRTCGFYYNIQVGPAARWPGGPGGSQVGPAAHLGDIGGGGRFLEMCELPVSPSRCQQVSQLGLMMRPGGFSWVMVSDG